MKVQIIQLEAHDDYISTRDKMGWTQTGRIVLVWPTRGRILNRKLDLVLLQRHSKALGVTFALVTPDSDVIHHADQLGIPIFENVRQALESPWRGKRRKVARIRRHRRPINPELLRKQAPPAPERSTEKPEIRIGAFIISMVALLALVSLFIPSAQLTLSPKHRPQEVKMTIAASPSFTGLNIAGEVPARFITTIVEGKDEIITTGRTLIPDQPAIGGVRFTNLTEDNIDIPEGTIVSTLGSDPIRFTTTKDGAIRGGIGHTVILPVKALVPGEEGNVPAEDILAIEGSLGLSLSVLNPMPTHDGSQTRVPIGSSTDRSKLYQDLLDILKDTALNELTDQLNQGDVIVEDTLKLSKVIEERYDPPEDQPANQLELTLQLEFEALSIQKNDLNSLANLVLDASLPEGDMAIPDTVEIKPEGKPIPGSDGVTRWEIVLRRDTMENIDPSQVVNMVLGLPTGQASLRMTDKFDLLKAPDIILTPSWWPRMPYLPFRVQVSNLEVP